MEVIEDFGIEMAKVHVFKVLMTFSTFICLYICIQDMTASFKEF